MNTAALLILIAWVESSNNPTKINESEQAYGLYGVRQCVLDDVNKKFHCNYTLQDMLNPNKAQIVFAMYMNIYATKARLGRDVTVEDMARIWNGGPDGWSETATEEYWKRIKREEVRLAKEKKERKEKAV